MKNNFFTRFVRSAVLLLALGFSGQAFANTMLLVTVNTEKFGIGTVGALDFTFMGTGFGPAATATMSQLSGFDLDPANFETLGDASSVPGGFQLLNSAGFNDVLYHTTFGGTVSFVLTLAGDVDGLNESLFSVFALDAGLNQIGDALLELSYLALPDGSAGTDQKSIDPAAVTVEEAPAAQVPEPGALALAGLGLLMLGVARRQRRI